MEGVGATGRGRGRGRLLAAMLACSMAAACGRTAPEAALRDALASLEEAVESRDAGDVAAHLAADFIGPGGLDREGARRLAAAHFLRHRGVAVVAGPYELELREGHARVRFTAVLTGGSGAALPAAARAWQVDSGWRDAGGAWELVSLEWTAVR